MYKINKELLKSTRNNNNMCLCKINVICPCDNFLNFDNCCCGLYVKNKKRPTKAK